MKAELKPCAHCGGPARWEPDEWENEETGLADVAFDIAVTHEATCIATGAWELEDVANGVVQTAGMADDDYLAIRAAIWNRRPAEDALRAERDALREALESVAQYGYDTLSGRADGPNDRAWQREGVAEMTRRAHAALPDFNPYAGRDHD